MLRAGFLFNSDNTMNSLESSGKMINGQWMVSHLVTNYACLPLHVAIRVELGSTCVQVEACLFYNYE